VAGIGDEGEAMCPKSDARFDRHEGARERERGTESASGSTMAAMPAVPAVRAVTAVTAVAALRAGFVVRRVTAVSVGSH
jgi:hypothetical protein